MPPGVGSSPSLIHLIGVLLLALSIAACGGPPQRPTAPVVPRSVLTGAALRQCLADLDGLGVRYRRVPDQNFVGGCQTIGTVELIDIGLPVTNLGPVTCPLARAMTGWVRDAVQPAARVWMTSSITRVETFGSYACRPINNLSGNALSEHAFANAVDVAAFDFADGRRVAVLTGWNGADDAARDFLRAVHASACRHFTTVLGPDANGYHANHIHLDMGRGPYCR